MRKLLFESIKRTVLQIEEELKTSNKTGIFFAPELYVAFCIGRDVSNQRQEIFGKDVAWTRETDIGGGGPSDILFKDHETYTVIELKLRDTVYSYRADVEKLSRIDSKHGRFFCVLLDSFTPTNDSRLTELESLYQSTLIKIDQFSFPTWNGWYTSRQVYCCLNLYQVM